MVVGAGGGSGWGPKGAGGNFQGTKGRCSLSPQCDGFMGVHICRNTKLYVLNTCIFVGQIYISKVVKIVKEKNPTDERINTMWSLHTREHHSAMKSGEALTLATTWMDPENTMLSERSQTQKDTQRVIPLMGNVQNKQIHRQRVNSWLSRAGKAVGVG